MSTGEDLLIAIAQLHVAYAACPNATGLVEGLARLRKAVRKEAKAEDKWRHQPRPDGTLPWGSSPTSNIGYLNAVYEGFLREQGVIGLLCRVGRGSGPEAPPLPPHQEVAVADIVSGWGRRWIKISSRRPTALLRALHSELYADPVSETTALFAQVRLLCDEARCQPQPTEVLVYLPRGVADDVRDIFEGMGATVHIGDPEVCPLPSTWRGGGYREMPPTPTILLDTTTLIALISDATHTPPDLHPIYPVEAMRLQILEEGEAPLLPRLQEIIFGRRVHVSYAAWTGFCGIVETIAGPLERRRAHTLITDLSASIGEEEESTIEALTRTDGLLLTASRPLAFLARSTGGYAWLHRPRSLCEGRRLESL